MIRHKRPLTTRMLKRAARARREHGIALLFTLCILSMTLVVAMIFSSSASTERKVAGVFVDTSAARIFADGIVNRAILALIQSNNASYVCSSYKTNPPDGNMTDYASDWIWKLEKPGIFEFNNGPLRFRNSAYYDINDSRCPSWEYVFAKNTYGDTNTTTERIFGRYAYVAIGQNDQLNPNAIGRKGTKYYSDFNDDICKKRLGRWTCELDFNFKSSRNNWNYESIVSPENIQSKYSSKSDNWDDIDLFVNELAGGGGATPSGSGVDKQLKMMADQYFDLSGQGEYNKYRPDGAAIGDLSKHELASGESYRFPLIRNDWNSIDVAAVKSTIPWFEKANTSQANVDQTVANLINYNASESRQAVSDADWFSGEPAYTGNKRTPYINEAHADVSVGGHLGFPMKRPSLEGDPPVMKFYLWYTDCTYSHEITLNIETVNLYDSFIPVKAPIPVGEISYEYLDPKAGNWIPQTIRFDAGSQPWNGAPTVTNSGIYTVYTFMVDNGSVGSVTTPERGPYDRPMGHEADFYEYIKVRNVRLSLDRVILQDNYGNADLALMPSQLSAGRTFAEETQVAGPGDFSKRIYFDTQVNDPRFNLARNQWSNPSFTEADDTKATLGLFNSTVNYNANDPNNFDPGEDPTNNKISTAYIRHGQMESLWELGAIHRGAPWQTINLKCASKNGTRMESYQTGDGHLLDQIALASSTDRATDSMLGLINLNCVASFGGSSSPFVFKSLFTNFPIYKTYAAMNSGSADGGRIVGDSVDSDKSGNLDADAFASDLSEAVTYAISQGNLPRRTAVFPTQYPASGSQMDHIIKRNVPDAEAEEIFCRVVNLLKWNKQPLKRATILVLAQTIKDVGGNVQLERVLSDKDVDVWRDSGFQAYDNSNKKTNPSGVTATTIRSTYEKRTVDLKQYDNFYDQITGETKIIVRLEWDESANDNKGKWIVTRKEYAE